MKWLNPFWLMGAMAAYTKEHFVAWHVSTVATWVGSAFPLSIAYPNWARDLVHTVWPLARDFSLATRDVVLEFLNTS